MATTTTLNLHAGLLSGGSHEVWFSTIPAAAVPRPKESTGVNPAGSSQQSGKSQPPPPPKGSSGGPTASGGSSTGGGVSSGGGPASGGNGGGTEGPQAGKGGPLPTSPSTGNTPVGGPISRNDILERAKYWARKGVPYSMSAYTNDPQGKSYRTDCSGLVSMALHLDSSLSTVSLPSQVDRIDRNDLKPGDIVGNLGGGTAGAAGHVMIFNGWTDASKTSFYTIEETPPRAVERTRTWGSHPYTSAAYRYKNVTD